MTYNSALKHTQALIQYDPEDYLKTIMEAVEKQIGVKPIAVSIDNAVNWTCGACRSIHRSRGKVKYCCDCGRAVNWK